MCAPQEMPSTRNDNTGNRRGMDSKRLRLLQRQWEGARNRRLHLEKDNVVVTTLRRNHNDDNNNKKNDQLNHRIGSYSSSAKGELRLCSLVLDMECVHYLIKEMDQLWNQIQEEHNQDHHYCDSNNNNMEVDGSMTKKSGTININNNITDNDNENNNRRRRRNGGSSSGIATPLLHGLFKMGWQQQQQQYKQQQPTEEQEHVVVVPPTESTRNNNTRQEAAGCRTGTQQQKAKPLFEGLILSRCRFVPSSDDNDNASATAVVEQFATMILARFITKRVTFILRRRTPFQPFHHNDDTSRRQEPDREHLALLQDVAILLQRGVIQSPWSTIESLTFDELDLTYPGTSRTAMASDGNIPLLLQQLLKDPSCSHVCDLGFHNCSLNRPAADTLAMGLEQRPTRTSQRPLIQQQQYGDQQQQQSQGGGPLRTLVVEHCSIDDDETMARLVRSLSPKLPSTTTRTFLSPVQQSPWLQSPRSSSHLEALTFTYHETSPALIRLLVDVLETHSELKCLSLTHNPIWPEAEPAWLATIPMEPWGSVHGSDSGNDYNDRRGDSSMGNGSNNNTMQDFQRAWKAHLHLQSLSWPQILPTSHPIVAMVQERNYWLWRLRNEMFHPSRTTIVTHYTTHPPSNWLVSPSIWPKVLERAGSKFRLVSSLSLLEKSNDSNNNNNKGDRNNNKKQSVAVPRSTTADASPIFFFLRSNVTEWARAMASGNSNNHPYMNKN